MATAMTLLYPVQHMRLFTLLFVLLFCAGQTRSQDTQTSATITDFDRPFLFAYGSWEGHAVCENGIARISGATNQGGAGVNLRLNLSAVADGIPAIKVRALQGNEMKVLRLMLLAGEEGKPLWRFRMPASDGKWHWVSAEAAATLKTPREFESDSSSDSDISSDFDISDVRQWQIIGDWAGGVAANFEIDSVVVRPATDKQIAERRAAMDQQEQTRQKAIKAEERRRNNLREWYGQRTERSPVVSRISLVAPEILAIEINAGKLKPAEYLRYEPAEGDKRETKRDEKGEVTEVLLVRDDKTIGWLIGENREYLVTWEQIVGDPLLAFVADEAKTFRLRTTGIKPVAPLKVHRKSSVVAWAQGPATTGVRHTLYLVLPQRIRDAVAAGKTVTVEHGELNTQSTSTEFRFDPISTRSDAIHVNQIGYRSDDPVKRAFVSIWLGNGGSYKQPNELPFAIVDDQSGKVVYRGVGERHFPATRPEKMAREHNFNGTDVARLDFSDFQKPGRYRVCIRGVGTSYPFPINEDVWSKAWHTQLRGLFHNRTGIELGPPHSDFRKPRDMHPADGYRVTRSTYRSVEAGASAMDQLVAGDTGEEIPGGWGGYHDAGDWNPRRVTHMKVTMAMLEVFEMFEDKLKDFSLNLPNRESLPDILAEAVFEFSAFQRLQMPNGGVGLGLESKGDPLPGEVSWHNSFASYAYAPDYSSSWFYSAAAARLSRLLAAYDRDLSDEILASGRRAFEFAEKDYARDSESGAIKTHSEVWKSMDHRNLAAIELYRTTSEERYHDILLEDTLLTDDEPDLFQWGKGVQRDQAFAYATLPASLGDDALKRTAVQAIERLAMRGLEYAEGNAFNLTSVDRGKPQFVGFYTQPEAKDMTRAHYLTGNQEYLAGAVQSTQFQSGCNPNNYVMISGLGANPLKHVFKLDARRTGQSVPAGLTPYGNIDFTQWNEEFVVWPIRWILGKPSEPNPYEWPTHEAYWDLGGWPMMEEFTVDAWAPNVYVWGYLAFRE